MFDRRDQHTLPPRAENGQMIGLGAAADKNHGFGRRADQRRHRNPGPLHRRPGRTTPAVHRGRVAAMPQRCSHRSRRVRPERCGGIPIEIGLGGWHGLPLTIPW
jgi:hypothetical protein